MNRRERRKLARNATPEETFPQKVIGPVQPAAAEMMRVILEAVAKAWPGYHCTVFVSEPPEMAAAGALPRFNYASTAQRPDMIAVLKAFIAKQEGEGGTKLARIHDAPPSEQRN